MPFTGQSSRWFGKLAAASRGAGIAAVAATILQLAAEALQQAFPLAAGVAWITARCWIAAGGGLASWLAGGRARCRLTLGSTNWLAAVVAAMLVAQPAE